VSVSRWGQYGSGVEALAGSCPQDSPEGSTPARIIANGARFLCTPMCSPTSSRKNPPLVV